MNADIDTVLEWRGRLVIDWAGEKVGRFEDIYLDAETDLPAWAGIRTGLLGRGQSLVPLSSVTAAGDDLRVPFDADMVESAPSVDPDAELSESEEAALNEHYGLAQSGDAGAVSTGETDDAMTRSEEEVSVEPRARPKERVRLKKYVVTEPVTKTVPVRREEIRVERVPVDEEDRDE